MKRLLAILWACFQLVVYAQTSEKYNSAYVDFYRAEELFVKEQFTAARIEFRNFINGFQSKNDPLYVKARYYEGVSALEMFHNDAVTLLTEFNRAYPESIYKHLIAFKIGVYFYQKKDFKEALVWLNQLSGNEVDATSKSEFYFKKGYASFKEEQFVQARDAFYNIKDDSSTYAPAALYYYSHIAYTNKTYQTALDGFLKLENDPSFSKVVPYYIAQIYHLQGKYDEVTKYAATVLDTSNLSNATDLNHIIGDAYYRIGKYDESVPYLEKYNQKSKTTRFEDYQLGNSYFKISEYAKAIKQFDRITDVKDSLSQVAYYQIAASYLKMNNQLAARTAFESVSEMEFDPKIQEDALYQHAVLSYKLDLNPYDEAVHALERFLVRYPNSKRVNDINQYLVNVYISTNNYAKALASLDQLPQKDAKLKTAYQIIAFNQGVQFFQKSQYDEAINSFKKVEKYPIDESILAKAKFWTADAYYFKGQMDPAVKTYKEFLLMPSTQQLKADAYYNLGYAYLKKKDTLQGIENFAIYVKNNISNKNKLADAHMRLGDGFYVSKQNEKAIKHYREVLNLKAGFDDQALFYIAKSHGYADQNNLKIQYLLDLINNYKNSKYTLASIYDVAALYKNQGEYDKSLRYFNQIITDYPNVPMVLDAQIESADILFKKGDYSKSEKSYLSLLEQQENNRPICEKIVRGLVDVYTATKQPDKAAALATSYSCANISTDEKEGLYFNPAMEQYLAAKYQEAASSFEKYLQVFPQGKFVDETYFYLGTAYYETKQTELAIKNYKSYVNSNATSNIEVASARVAQYLYNSNQYQEATEYYKRLEKVSSKPSDIFSAQLGLMRCNFLTQNWNETVQNAKSVLKSTQINNALRMEAEYALGISAYNMENHLDAKPSLEWLIKNTTTAMGAEARFTLAEMYYKQKDYLKADQEIRSLLKMKPSYNYWVAKGLILQSRILMLKDELFQAEETLKSVLDHYPNNDDGIKMEADELYNELLQLKNKGKNVEENQETIIELNQGGN